MGKSSKRIKKISALYLLPSVIGVALFFVLPFLVIIYYSLIDNPIAANFVFLDNFISLLQNKAFKMAAANSLTFSFTAVPLAVVLSLGIAFLLDKNIPGKSRIRTAFLSPMMVPIASVILIWQVLFHYNGLVNEWYLEDMSENIRSVLTSRRENGFHIGSFAPYGYRKDPTSKGHLIIDEEAAGIVREIFNLFADGYGKTAIAKILNDRGIPNPTEYKRKKGFRYTPSIRAASPLWKYSSVQWVLTNEVYIGNLVQGRAGSVSYKTKQIKSLPKEQWIKVEGTHEPIIELELWNRVQKKINSSARTNPSTGKIHTFSKIAVCMHCGYAMRVHKCHGHYYLQCETKSISKAACPGAFIPEAELEQIVIDELRKFNHYLLDQGTLERKVEFDYVMNSKKSKLFCKLTIFSLLRLLLTG